LVSALIPMSITYKRDDQRHLITVTMTEPCSVDDILTAIDRHSAEDTWAYAILYDLRGVSDMSAEADLQQIAERVKVAAGGRERGPVGIAIRARPALFLLALTYTRLTRESVTVEVLLSVAQTDAWLARNAPCGLSRQP
jgi:hypothetical protein